MIYNDDCLKVLKNIKKESIDLIIADPPYFISNNGLSIHNGKIVSVNKGNWDNKSNYESTKVFTTQWLTDCKNCLRKNASIWISGTTHNIFEVYEVLTTLEFKINDVIIWEKTDPPPLIYKTRFKFSYEFIIWASKEKYGTFNYQTMFKIEKGEMGNVWKIPAVQMSEKKYGYHPTQKPIRLIKRIILATSKINDLVLDPFMGSGTTGAAAILLKRNFIGIEKEEKYFNIAKKRITALEKLKQ
jgi:site-specific DNA-methyltransferase (adenine-specific)